MTSQFFELECLGDTVVMERRDDGKLVFHGWDQEAEEAAQELGFEPSLCSKVWTAHHYEILDDVLLHSIIDHDTPLVAALLASGADPNAIDMEYSGCYDYDEEEPYQDPKSFPLGLAIDEAYDEADTDIITLLIEAGADVNASQGYALTLSSRGGSETFVEALLAAGADVHANNDIAINEAANEKHWGIVKLLLQAGANPGAISVTSVDIEVVKCWRRDGRPLAECLLEWIEKHC